MFVYLHSRSTGAAPDSVPGRSDDTGDTEEGGADFRLGLCCAGTDGFSCWSDGRVARQRSAKPCTAVRIRFRPHRNRVAAIYNAVLFLNCHTFVIPTFIRGWFLQYKITSYRYPDEFGGLLDSFYHLILAIVFGLHLV